MTKEDLAAVQKIDTEILFNVVDICEKHDIQYFLMYGTLLGAVRHGGPIPWDDDVDIGMTRENYNKFLKVAPAELDPRNEIKIMGSGFTDYISEIKIGRKGTVYCMPGTENLDIMNKVQLDIFLIDHVKKIGKIKSKLRSILKIIALNWDEKKLMLINIRRSNKRFKLFYCAGLYFFHIIRVVLTEKGIEKILYNMVVDKKGDSSFLGVAMYKQVWNRELMDDSIDLQYDGRYLNAPIGYDELLSVVYGDYMKLPPEDKRLRNHFDEWIFKYEE